LWNFDLNSNTATINAVQVVGNLGLNQADTNTYNILQVFQANNTGNADILRALASVNGASTRDGLHNALQSVEPTLDGSDFIGAQSIDNETMDITGQQLAALRGGETGVAAGASLKGLRAWGQMFGSHVNQNARGGVDGYSADTWGGTLGVD